MQRTGPGGTNRRRRHIRLAAERDSEVFVTGLYQRRSAADEGLRVGAKLTV
jgi:hypothetical protein